MIGGFFLNGVILPFSWREVIVVYLGNDVLGALWQVWRVVLLCSYPQELSFTGVEI
ncbi:hypothetical protein [Anaplasma phagocytophilum]|uniref:hypothetical protein n=1 Tax=Anaplasma phagocytophilum TaxID=948 RepID=UPI00200F47CF|nr:hypothetical protein [Anaplasma phagocytophilum]